MARPIVVLGLSLTCAAPAFAAENIDFLAEHAVESGMDAAYMALPWPGGREQPGAWDASIDLSTAHTITDFMHLDGKLLGASAVHGLTARWAYELVASYGEFAASGGAGQVPLARKALAEAPLDLPQVGEFSGLRGTQKQLSLGAAAVRERHATGARRSTQLIAGLLLERVEVGSLRMGYRLASGGDSGVAHTLQYAASPSFVTPFVGWQQTRQASARFAWSPRAMLVVPLPPRDLDVALAGSPLDPAAPPDSPPIQMGDAFIVLGLALRHRPSGLEIDLGGRVYYAAAESASHPGVDGARVVHIAWHHGVR